MTRRAAGPLRHLASRDAFLLSRVVVASLTAAVPPTATIRRFSLLPPTASGVAARQSLTEAGRLSPTTSGGTKQPPARLEANPGAAATPSGLPRTR
ncbi:hypothetical protein [Candidatus Poriferisodalis sp.]|uniref:hypothetical protein n=1 Tax=Candidatus Poriferisodalis sp. TaxID=3101277 RepID=UPI003B01C088